MYLQLVTPALLEDIRKQIIMSTGSGEVINFLRKAVRDTSA
jgi:hypothetical protein